MPAVSPAQERLMQAAAHTKGGYGGVPQSVGKEFVGDADGSGLYVSRKLTAACAEAFTAWATEQGFANLTPTDELHTTIVYSRTPLALEPEGGEIAMPDDGNRSIQPLGDKGAVVLRFGSVPFRDRWQRAIDAGASWDHDGFHPHVTITYDAGGKDLSTVKPFSGSLIFGPEVHAPLNENWAEEKGYRTASDEAITDSVGRKHYDRVPISKAAVNEYKGSEIPKWQELGLEADKLYRLLRDPEELAKAAPSFNGIQLLIQHTPVSAEDHKPYDIAGAVGTSAEFEKPYLYNAVTVWTQAAIDGVEDKTRHELSSSYQYDADMTPGKYEGQPYDGVMRNIRGNHVAVIPKGRVGPDVALDEALPHHQQVKTEKVMTKKTAVPSRTAIRLQAALSALAMDEKINLTPVVKGVTAKNLASRKTAIAKATRVAFDEMGATSPAGATPDDVIMKVLSMVEGQTAAEPAEMDEAPPAAAQAAPTTEPNSGAPAEGGKMDMAKIKQWLASKGMGEDDMSELDGMMGDPAEDEDETEEEKKAREAEAAAKAAKDAEMSNMVSKPAMDQAISAAVAGAEKRMLETGREINSAFSYVRPWVGDLANDSAITGPSDVYRKALTSLGVSNAATLHADALRAVLDAQPKPGARQPRGEVIAMDSAAEKSLADRFPHAARISNLG